MMNANNSQEKLDLQTKKDLASAYHSVYESIVEIKLAKGMSKGQSWHSALNVMGNLLKDQALQNNNPLAMEYLIQLFNTHKKVQSKKSMLANNRDEKLETVCESENSDLLLNSKIMQIIAAYKQLLKLIKSKQITDDSVLAKYLLQIINNTNKTRNYQNKSSQNQKELYLQHTLNSKFGNQLQR